MSGRPPPSTPITAHDGSGCWWRARPAACEGAARQYLSSIEVYNVGQILRYGPGHRRPLRTLGQAASTTPARTEAPSRSLPPVRTDLACGSCMRASSPSSARVAPDSYSWLALDLALNQRPYLLRHC